MKLFFLVLARDRKNIKEKIRELINLRAPYLIVCGEPLNHPNVVHRKPMGKYDAINFGAELVPKEAEIIALNDVDTKIYNFHAALKYFNSEKTALVFVKTVVIGGPQNKFIVYEDAIRRHILITAGGGLMLIRHNILKEILPIRGCKAEDTYILFELLKRKFHVVFCEECCVEQKITKSEKKEEDYKRKVVTGIYQALHYAKPPPPIRLFYTLLPFMSPSLLVLGRKGYYWMKGILLGFLDYIRGDRSGFWQPTYME